MGRRADDDDFASFKSHLIYIANTFIFILWVFNFVWVFRVFSLSKHTMRKSRKNLNFHSFMTNPQHAPINRLSLVLPQVSSSPLAHSHESIFQHRSNSITWYAYAVALPVSLHTCDFHNFFITFSKAWIRCESHTIWGFTYMLKVETIQIRWAQQHIFPVVTHVMAAEPADESAKLFIISHDDETTLIRGFLTF